MSEYSEFFLKSSGSIVQLECLAISHPNFTKTYYVVRNAANGISATYENGVTYAHDYYPMKIETLGARGDLDQGFNISFGDLGDIIPKELDAVFSADGFLEKPLLYYRTFRSDDLSKPLFGPLKLQITTFSFTREGAAFEAKAPALNINKTGKYYRPSKFPMLRGFL